MRAYIKLNDEEDSKIMKQIPGKNVCRWYMKIGLPKMNGIKRQMF